MNTGKQQRLALRALDEARRVYRWWRAIAVVNALAIAVSLLGGLALFLLVDDYGAFLGILGWPLAFGCGVFFRRTVWPPMARAFITRRDAQWAWEDAMLADEEAAR